MNILRPVLSTVFVLAMVMSAPAFASAEAAPAMTVELNNAQQSGTGCTLSFVFRNRLKQPVEAMSLEVVLFNGDGLVDKFLRLNTGALPVGKMRVKQFALKGRNCADISRILINDVPGCKGGNLTPAICLRALKISSRARIELAL